MIEFRSAQFEQPYVNNYANVEPNKFIFSDLAYHLERIHKEIVQIDRGWA